MILTAQRFSCDEHGAFYRITDEQGKFLFFTAARTYQQDDGSWAPKVGAGTYTLQRGLHTIPNGRQFDTFEITGVPGHGGLLFCHSGNEPQVDSEGCHIAGASMGYVDGQRAVVMSNSIIDDTKHPPGYFSRLTAGIDSFTLLVLDEQ